MGDRISIQFVDSISKEKSVVLFSHWDGTDIIDQAQKYLLREFDERIKDEQNGPLARREVSTVMVDFISWLTGGDPVGGNYYLGAAPSDGDNGDNGHFEIDVRSGASSKA